MNFLDKVTSNIYINTAVISWFIAQSLKVVLTLLTTRKLKMERFMGNGGMPSSHTSFTVSLAVLIMRSKGFASLEFALSFCFAIIVMTDAMGVRREAGKHAKALNDVFFELSYVPKLFKSDKPKPVEVDVKNLENIEAEEKLEEKIEMTSQMKLEEFLGHTPFEVLGGLILGIIIGFLMPIS